MNKKIGWILLFFMLGGCASTANNKAMNMQAQVSEIHYMNDTELCYGFFTIKAEEEWYRYENIRRIRRLDCENYRAAAQARYKGKKINYAALNVTKLFKKSAATENPSTKQPILEDKTLNQICYVKINDLVFAKRGGPAACNTKAGAL